jgi:MerR family transcriptional regulator, copper efflux regulator
MQISEFAHAVGLSTDTVRFYIKQGLLTPQMGTNRYQVFDDDDIEAARLINVGQLLGITLRELALFRKECETVGISNQRLIEILNDRLVALNERAAEIKILTDYVERKIAWLKSTEQLPEPFLEQFDNRITARKNPSHHKRMKAGKMIAIAS